jgi:hypothetical protein
MKKFFLYVPIVLSLLVLGAHFLRYGNTIVVISIVVSMGLLFVPRWWVARLMQLVFALGALEWLRTTVVLIQARMIMDAPYLRLAVILGVVAAVTLLAGLLFQTRELKAYYRLERSS